MLCADFCNDARKLVHLPCTEYKVDMGRAAHQTISLFLCHAACDAKDQTRIFFLDLLNFTDLSIHLVLCRLTHTAGIDEHNVSACRLLRGRIPGGLQLSLHAFCICNIHLAAINQNLIKSRGHSFPLTFTQKYK